MTMIALRDDMFGTPFVVCGWVHGEDEDLSICNFNSSNTFLELDTANQE